jgi:hypothetical protein
MNSEVISTIGVDALKSKFVHRDKLSGIFGANVSTIESERGTSDSDDRNAGSIVGKDKQIGSEASFILATIFGKLRYPVDFVPPVVTDDSSTVGSVDSVDLTRFDSTPKSKQFFSPRTPNRRRFRAPVDACIEVSSVLRIHRS